MRRKSILCSWSPRIRGVFEKISRTCIYSLFCLLVAAVPVSAQFHVASLQSLSRLGGQAGKTVNISVRGERLEETAELRFSHPAIRAQLQTTEPLPLTNEQRPAYGDFIVDLPGDLVPGRYEIRALGRHGLTNPRSFLVTKLPHQTAASVSSDSDTATALAKNAWQQAAVAAQQQHWYAIQHDQSGPLQIRLLAQQLDSPLIGQLSLYDASGESIATAGGAADFDPVLSTTELPAGTYRLSVHDFAYRGGDEFQYLLLVTDRKVTRREIVGTAKQTGQLPLHTLPLSSPLTSVDPLTESDDAVIQFSLVELTTTISRVFAPRQTDHAYDFAAQQGQQYVFDVVSQRFGQPTDPRLTLQRIEPQASDEPKLHDLAHADDRPNVTDGVISLGSRDPVTVFTAPADSTYRLLIRDLDIGTSLLARQSYRLCVRQPDPGFDLVAYRPYPHSDLNASRPHGTKLFRGGAEMIRVFAVRRDGWTGPIKVRVENLPAGVTCGEGFIAANQDKVQLSLAASEQASGLEDSLRIVGRNEEGSVTAVATPLTIVRGRGHDRNTVQSRITTRLPVLVSESDVAPLSVAVGDGTAAEVKQGETLSLPIRLVRRDGGAAACVCRPRDFPPGVRAAEVTIAADQSEAAVEIKPNPDAPPGTYSIWLQVETKIKFAPNPQALKRAEAYRNQLQKLHDDPAQADKLEAVKAAIVEADKRIEAAKAAAAPREQTIFIPTNHATIRVVTP